MLRKTLLVLLVLGTASPAWAGEAEGLFEELTCDFGSVPHGQKLIHLFRIVNNTKNSVHINNVRVGCHCTAAKALQYNLAPGQETAILAEMDSGRFEGVRAVNIFVLFDTPRLEEVKLAVTANSRSELSFYPETLDFAKIKRGTTPTSQMLVTFIGYPQVQITDVRCDSNYIQPKVQEFRREMGKLIFQLSATVRADTPEGKWYTDVWLTTNIAAMPRLRVPLTVEVEPPVMASNIAAKPPLPPKTGANVIVLAPVKAGIESIREVELRSTQPFRITAIVGGDGELAVRPVSGNSEAVHKLNLTFRPSQVGLIYRTIRVTTDMANSKEIEFTAQTQSIP